MKSSILWYILVITVLITSCNKEENLASTLPIIKLTADEADLFSDSTGIYVKGIGTATNWQGEKANYFDKRRIQANFSFEHKGRELLNQDIMMRVSGGGSRKQAQKSFNLYADKSVGPSYFHYPFFSDLQDSFFNTLRLRNSGQDWNRSHMRDALMHTIVQDLDIYGQAYEPVVVYLNSRYWGIYNLREKFNKNYIRRHQNFSKDVMFDILERHYQVDEGSEDDYVALVDYLLQHDLSDQKHFNHVISQIDTANFLDYYCAQIYFANTDWPGNNIKYWKARLPDAKWNWFMHDTDLGFALAPLFMHPGGVDHNTLAFNLNDQGTNLHNQPWATLLFRKLTENQACKEVFVRHFHKLLDDEFSAERVIPIIDELQSRLSPEMPRHIERWKAEDPSFYQSVSDWETEVELLRDFAHQRADIVKGHLEQWD